MHIFYYGLSDNLKNFVDASCRGNFLSRDAEGAFQLFENMSENSLNNASMAAFNKANQPRSGVYEVNKSSNLVDLQLIAQRLDKVELVGKNVENLDKKLDNLLKGESSLGT